MKYTEKNNIRLVTIYFYHKQRPQSNIPFAVYMSLVMTSDIISSIPQSNL